MLRQLPPQRRLSFAPRTPNLNTARRVCWALAACGLAAVACKTNSDSPVPAPASSASGTAAAPPVSATLRASLADGAAPPAEVAHAPRNVLLLTIDSLRADMPWTGYPRAIAPNLSKLAALRAFRNDPIALLERLAAYGDVVRVDVPGSAAFLLNHPDFVRDVLVTEQRSFHKGPTIRAAKMLLGESLLTSEDE